MYMLHVYYSSYVHVILQFLCTCCITVLMYMLYYSSYVHVILQFLCTCCITVLMAGEQVVNTHVHTQHSKLSHVVSVMADHKRRQSKTFKFPVPSDSEVCAL